MKKMLMLILILGIASFANAAISLQTSTSGTSFSDPGAAITLLPSDTVWIGVNQDIAENFAAYVIMDTTSLGSWTGLSAIYSPPALAAVVGWTYYGTGVDPGMDAWFGDFTLPGLEQGGPGVFGAVQFHCEAPGDVLITLYDEAFVPVDTLTIHQIPEPATMALLGLGGLFLRRRK